MSTYLIHPISSTRDPVFAKAIAIYADSIPSQIRTNTNEIGMWLDTYNQRFAPDSFHALALLNEQEVIGYCQYVAFPAANLIAVDYICIAKENRRGTGVFCTFVNQLKEHADRTHPGLDVILEAIDLPVYGRRFGELLRRTGFATMPYPYTQPALGDMPSDLHGCLMIYPARAVSPSEFLRIFRCLQVNHYGRWYSYLNPTPDVPA